MSNDNLPKPPGHKSFIFESICISSDFDSGNCCNAEKIGNNQVVFIRFSLTYGLPQITRKIITGHGFIFQFKELRKD